MILSAKAEKKMQQMTIERFHNTKYCIIYYEDTFKKIKIFTNYFF